MSVIDKVLGAVTPPESAHAREKATAKARAAAGGREDWLAMALDHHDEIREGFAAAKAASPSARPDALKRLARVLNAHVVAEEVVLYPALAHAGEKAHAAMAYLEQSAAKIQMYELELLDPASKDWDDKLEHIEGAVLHHVFEEEGGWFLELKEKGLEQGRLSLRYAEEHARYLSGAATA